MESTPIQRIADLLDAGLSIKENLAPGGVDRHEFKTRLRLAFPCLSKSDTTTPYVSIRALLVNFVETEADAMAVFPRFREIIPYLFKVDSLAVRDIHFHDLRKIFAFESPGVVERLADEIFRTSRSESKAYRAKRTTIKTFDKDGMLEKPEKTIVASRKRESRFEQAIMALEARVTVAERTITYMAQENKRQRV